MSHPATPPSPDDPTASMGANRDGHTRSFDPPPADPYSPPAPPPIPAYQPPPVFPAPPIPAYQPPQAYQPPPAYQAPPPAYQPQPPAYQPPVSPYQPPGGYPPQYQPMPVATPTSSWSVASLVLGVIGIVAGWCVLGIPCLLAIVFGHLGLNDTKHGAKTGRGMAIAGLVLGYLCLVPIVLIVIWSLSSEAGYRFFDR